MKLYIRMVRPMLSYPGQRYEPKYKNIESELVWYPEEDIPRIREKYKHLENTFEQVVFDVKYEPIDAIPVEWLWEHDLYYAGISGGSPYMNALIKAWQKEQEVR